MTIKIEIKRPSEIIVLQKNLLIVSKLVTTGE